LIGKGKSCSSNDNMQQRSSACSSAPESDEDTSHNLPPVQGYSRPDPNSALASFPSYIFFLDHLTLTLQRYIAHLVVKYLNDAGHSENVHSSSTSLGLLLSYPI
jgi:hypothetical protein